MKIFKLFIFIFLFCLGADITFAQEQKKEKIEAIKAAFITNKLNLTTDEAQKFWPVYNQYHKEIIDLFELRREARKNDDNSLDEDLEYDVKIITVRKKYKNEFLKVLSPEKTNQFYQAEREFREELIKQLKNRR